jgi:predicted nucleic acid-binding protein
MKVLLDVNVVLDVLLQRQPWLADAQAVWDTASDGRLECCLCASSLTDIFYIARKLVGQDPAREIVSKCLDNLTVLPVDHRVLKEAHAGPEGDFEDAMQIAVAIHAGVDTIVTCDLTGFANSPVAVWSPTQLVEHLTTVLSPP